MLGKRAEFTNKTILIHYSRFDTIVRTPNDCLVVTYDTPEGKGHLVQDKRFYEALRKDREMNKRKYKSGRRIKGRAKYTISPSKPQYAMDVEVRPLSIYDQSVEEVRP